MDTAETMSENLFDKQILVLFENQYLDCVLQKTKHSINRSMIALMNLGTQREGVLGDTRASGAKPRFMTVGSLRTTIKREGS